MVEKNNDFLKHLLATFKVEAEEHIQAISSGLIEVEKAEGAEKQKEIIETVFREAHSLKGAARAVNHSGIASVCQSLESVFAILKRREIALSSQLFDVLHNAVDTLHGFLADEAEGAAEGKSKLARLIRELEDAAKGVIPSVPPEPHKKEDEESPSPEKPSAAETVRISTGKLDSILLQAEEMLSAKLATNQYAAEIWDVNAMFGRWKKEWARAYPEVRRIQRSLERKGKGNLGKTDFQFSKLFGFLNWNYDYIKSLEDKLTWLAKLAEHNRYSLSGMVDHLLQDMKKACMHPFSSLLEIFPKIVRDLSREQGKEVELMVKGGEVEIDRRILEEMKDPLIHLVRNSIDHGIEKAEERARKQKSPRGTIAMAISPRDGNVEIIISDDGAGISIDRVRAASLKFGVISPGEAERLTEPEVLLLIYKSGVSTSPIVTDVSGRGLGLAIVREKVEKLGGTIAFETHLNAGTTFRLILPLTLATFRGVLIRVGEHLLIIPSASIERVLKVDRGEIKTVENRQTVRLNGQAISFVRIADVLELFQGKERGNSSPIVQMVVLGSAERRVAFAVDEILNEQEVLMKSLGKQLSRVRNIAGATVLGAGQVVPILNISDLIKSAVKGAAIPAGDALIPREVKERRKSILVAEDSITARTLLKNILESAGYDVKTAVDGVDAFTTLRTEGFDLVVSDVDMPRMSGFELTAKIRTDKRFSELPVVLVTALESREDRERGIDVGANAYIVKSSFDQSNLLEVIRRLI